MKLLTCRQLQHDSACDETVSPLCGGPLFSHQVAYLERTLARAQEALDLASAGASNAALLRAELTSEHQARRSNEEQLAAMQVELAQVLQFRGT